MEKLKLINLFLLVFIVTLFVQYTLFPKKNTTIPPSGAYISVASQSVTIPNIPKVTLHNTTSGSLTLNPCVDINITIDSVPLTGLQESVPDFCKTIVAQGNMTTPISLDPLYDVFAKKSGNYIITIKTPFGDRQVAFIVHQPGFFRSTLSFMIYEPIYNLFVAMLTWVTGSSLGWAILIVTVIIRLILLVPQQQMIKSQKKMQIIQPKIKAIQKEYKNDQAQLGMKMMELYKKEGVNPAGSCLPFLIQMPILIGLYWVVRDIDNPSNFYHLYRIFQDFKPATIDTVFYGINLAQIGGNVAMVFGFLLAIAQWLQAYLSFSYNKTEVTKQEKKPTPTNPDTPSINPETMQKMMLYMMPIMIGVSALFFPLGVGLYWFVGTLFVIAQQYYVNISEKKKAEKGEIVKR